MGSRACWASVLALFLVGCEDSAPRRAKDAARERASFDGARAPDLLVDRSSRDGARQDALADARPDHAPLDQAGPSSGTIVPLYAYPTHGSWTQLAQAKQANPSVEVVAIVNVNSGPGSAPDANFTSGIQKLAATGVVPIGYVDTSYATIGQAAVKADIDKWKSFYPQVTGVFFDQQANTAGTESYYQAVSSYAKAKGLGLTVGNPGADVPQSYIGVVDTMFIYESGGLPPVASLGGWHATVDKRSFGIIPYGVPLLDPAFVAAAKKTIGYIYITDDTLPNPWDTLPAYFTQLLAELAK